MRDRRLLTTASAVWPTFRPRAMSTPQVIAAYDAAGTSHEVLVTRDPAGRWQVVDVAGSQARLVETLTGHDDRLRQAQALARDYIDQQRAFYDGERVGDPLPHGADAPAIST